MATYLVTTSNWNDPDFWAKVDGSGGGHTLSFAGLPAGFSIQFGEGTRLSLSNGKTSFVVGTRSTAESADAVLPGGTTLADFPTILGSQGGDRITATDGVDVLAGGAGNDGVSGGNGGDVLSGGSGRDTIDGEAGNDIIAGDAARPVVIAETDFSGGVPPWITRPDGTALNVLGKLNNGDPFLGPFAGNGKGTETARATVEFAEGATHGVVTFDFVVLDSWDDSVTWGLAESLVVHINGEPAFSILGLGLQNPSGSFDGGRWEIGTNAKIGHLGGSSAWTDSIVPVRIVLYDPPPKVSIGWGSTTNQSVHDESFGIDSFRAVSLTKEAGGDADEVHGGSGSDLIFGGDGNDSLFGGADRDAFEGGAGDDSIVTGTGRDTIVLTRGSGTDTVRDFATVRWGDGTTEDRIDISQLRGGSGPGGTVLWRDIVVGRTPDGDAILSFPEGERLILTGVPPSQFGTYIGAQSFGIPCFTAGTLIRTLTGEVPIERLRPGDLVQTRDNGLQPLRWVAMRRLGSSELMAQPDLLPVRIAPGALGNDRSLLVSPQHGMLVGFPGGGEGLARAIQLARMRGGGVRVARGVKSVTYLHLAFDRHEVVFSNGIPSESFHPGKRALAGLAAEARAEFARLFPDLAAYGSPARDYLRSRDLPPRLSTLPLLRA